MSSPTPPPSPDDDPGNLDPAVVEADFLDSYRNAYGTGDDIVHLAFQTRRRLVDNPQQAAAALDNGITLAILEPHDGASYFNLALMLADLGEGIAALFSFLGALRLLEDDDPDRLFAAERATSLAAELGLRRAAGALHRQLGPSSPANDEPM